MPIYHGRSQAELDKLEENAPVEGTPSKGIPYFWYHCLTNTVQISDNIYDYDKPILNFLNDVTVSMNDSPPVSFIFCKFILGFYFEISF